MMILAYFCLGLAGVLAILRLLMGPADANKLTAAAALALVFYLAFRLVGV